MSTRRTPEESAQFLLTVMMEHQVKVGGTLLHQPLLQRFLESRRSKSDLSLGLQFALGHHWVELEPVGIVRLTKIGFVVAGGRVVS